MILAQKLINNGAQPSDAVRRMLESVDVLEKTVTE